MVGVVVDGPDAADAPGAQALAGLGDRVRQLRSGQGLSQAELGQRAGLPASYVDDVERAVANPSLAELARVANGLGVSISELLTGEKPGPAVVVVRAGEAQTVSHGEVELQVLTPRSVVPGLYAARYRIPPSAPGVRPVQHEGLDWLYVLRGELRIEFNEQVTTLRPGDTASFSSRVPHRLSAAGGDRGGVPRGGGGLPGCARAIARAAPPSQFFPMWTHVRGTARPVGASARPRR